MGCVLDGRPGERRGGQLKVKATPWLGQDNTERHAGANSKYVVTTLLAFGVSKFYKVATVELVHISGHVIPEYGRVTSQFPCTTTTTTSSVEPIVHHRPCWALLSYNILRNTYYLPLDISSYTNFPHPSLSPTSAAGRRLKIIYSNDSSSLLTAKPHTKIGSICCCRNFKIDCAYCLLCDQGLVISKSICTN